MIRVLATFLYYFRWQRTMAWTTGIGIAVLILGFILPERPSFFPIMFGSVLAVGFPIVFAGIAFREMISNRRFVMVPEIRLFAALSLLLLALTGSGISLIFANYLQPDIPLVDPASFVVLTFSVLSAYLLISQWMVTHTLGLIGFAVLPLVGLRIGMSEGSLTTGVLSQLWLLAALALLGWAWLLVATRTPSASKPLASPAWGQSGAPGLHNDHGTYQWLPQWGTAASASGTIMRAMRDGVQNRLAYIAMTLLAFPVAMWAVLFLLGVPLNDPSERPFDVGFLLIWSLFGLAMYSSTVIREWPARLRYLWLRTAGNRNASWQRMERALMADMLAVFGLAVLIAVPFGLFASIELEYLGLYVAGSVMISLFATYTGFWTRASNWHELVNALTIIFLVLLGFGSVAFINNADRPEMLYWLIPTFGVLTLIVRTLARRRVARIDWCAVRPARRLRKAG